MSPYEIYALPFRIAWKACAAYYCEFYYTQTHIYLFFITFSLSPHEFDKWFATFGNVLLPWFGGECDFVGNKSEEKNFDLNYESKQILWSKLIKYCKWFVPRALLMNFIHLCWNVFWVELNFYFWFAKFPFLIREHAFEITITRCVWLCWKGIQYR
jgi:hypothetical protein